MDKNKNLFGNEVIDYDIKNSNEPFRTNKNLIIQNQVKNSTLIAKGNIICYEDCENCNFISETGTVFLLFGSLSNTNITAKKNIYVKHSLNSKLNAGQDIIIEKSVYMSNLVAGGKILSESKESKIIGGTTRAKTLIMSNEIGNEKSVSSDIIIDSSAGEVIFGKIYKGVKIKIGVFTYTIKTDISRGRAKIFDQRIDIVNI